MDGKRLSPVLTPVTVLAGKTFSYEYTVGQAGTFFYHSHDHPDRQQGLGLYGALIIDPATAPAERQAAG